MTGWSEGKPLNSILRAGKQPKAESDNTDEVKCASYSALQRIHLYYFDAAYRLLHFNCLCVLTLCFLFTMSKTLPAWAVPDIISYPSFNHTELLLEQRIKSEVAPPIKLDTDAQICRAHLSPSGCSLGAECPKRHTNPSSLNYAAPVLPSSISSHGKTVCKHWLRGLCKKGMDCEFLHEYNLRKMPECWFFTKHGFCSSGDECMYLHITPHQRRPECRSYTAGFCRAGKPLHPLFELYTRLLLRKVD